MPSDPLRVVFLLGNSGDAAAPCMQRICQLPDILPVGILVDTHRPGWRIRLRNLTRNVRREGLAYPIHRLGSAVRAWVERFAARVAPPGETDALLRKAFPDRCFTVHDVAARYRIPIHAAGNLNSTFAASTLQDLSADLAIVLGTRILRRSTFAVPRFGSINLHKGKVPEYRGMPP